MFSPSLIIFRITRIERGQSLDLDEAAHDESPHLDLPCLQIQLFSLLAQLFSKKTLRYCHSPLFLGLVTFSYIFIITEDIYLKLRLIVTIKGEPIPIGQVTLKFF